MVLGSLDQIEIWNPDAYRASEEAGQHEIAGGPADEHRANDSTTTR